MPWTRDHKKPLRILLSFGVLIVGGVALYLLREPLAASTRSWRSSHNLNKAKEALGSEEQWESAYEFALMARQLNPASIEALRVLVDASFRSRSVRTLEYANTLFLFPEATEADQLAVLRIMYKARDQIGFVRLYNLLSDETRQLPGFVTLRASFLISRNAFDSARRLLESNIAENRDRQHLLLLASILIQPSSSPEDLKKGQEIIRELSISDNPDQLARSAFRLLGFIDPEKMDPSLLGDLGRSLGGESGVSSNDFIAAANLAIASTQSPEERERIVDETIVKFGSRSPQQIAAWLALIGEGDRVLDFLTEEKCLQSPQLYEQRFIALIQSGEVDAAGEWLETPPPGISSINIWLARARLSRAKAELAEENHAWEQAFKVAQMTSDRNEYLRIFEVASQNKRIDLATRALLKAPTHPNGIIPPAADLVAPMMFLTRNERLQDLRFLTEALAVREPDNLMLLNNLIYLNLLLGDKVEPSTQSAAQLVEKEPERLPLRTTCAMGHLILGNPTAALEVLPPVDSPQWKTATSADRAILACSLERSGKIEASEAIWEQVNKEELTKPELLIFFPPPPETGKDAEQPSGE